MGVVDPTCEHTQALCELRTKARLGRTGGIEGSCKEYTIALVQGSMWRFPYVGAPEYSHRYTIILVIWTSKLRAPIFGNSFGI